MPAAAGPRHGPDTRKTTGTGLDCRQGRSAMRLTVWEPLGEYLGQLGLHSRLGSDQPLKIVRAEPEELARFGAPHGGQAGIAVAASPVPGGELAEMLTRAEDADQPVIDENAVTAGQRDIEIPVCIPPADDLFTGGHV